MKKTLAILLALVMILSLATVAMADTTEKGSITVNNTVEGQTYSIYRIFDLVSYDTENGNYSYKLSSKWADFTADDYFTVNGNGYIEWVEGKDNDAGAKAFAAVALAYAKENSIAAEATAEATGTSVTFGITDNGDGSTTKTLDLGYYLVQSSVGTILSINTTKPDATVNDKNEKPTVEKEVQEDSKIGTDDEWGETNDADIGQTVNYRTTINYKVGNQNYVLHDKMDSTLDLNQNSIVVTVGSTTLTAGDDYTVAYNVIHDGADTDTTDDDVYCDFVITFDNDYLATLTENCEIVVSYSAVLNETAKIYDEGNVNTTGLTYGNKTETAWDSTITYTYKFELYKTDTNNNILNGAKFELYDAETDGSKIALVEENGVYRVATAEEKAAADFESAVIEAGTATIVGLDGQTTYWLEETEAPTGYNKLSGRVKVEITDENLVGNAAEGVYANGGVEVENKSGTELPTTGGIGTTLFYVIGGILVVAAAVVLVTKKRMTAAE